MTAYLWIAIIGLVTFAVGAVGHVWTTRLIETNHSISVERTISYFDMERGWIRTWIDNSPDADRFWTEHKIVRRDEKP